MRVYTIVYNAKNGETVAYYSDLSRLHSYFVLNDAITNMNDIKKSLTYMLDGSPRFSWFRTIRTNITSAERDLWYNMLTTIRVIPTDLTEVI